MANLILNNSGSPFDGIRRIDENGNEFWCARELMPLLGYQQWRRFKDVIDNAIENIETLTSSTVEHFLPVETKNINSEGKRLQGRTGIDYKLSRLACYHVALSCDSRGNDSVKAAKHYFAVKTREAETVIPAQNDRIRELELEIALANAETQKMLAEKTILDTRHLIVSTCPEPIAQKILGYQEVKVVEYRDRHYLADSLVNDGSTLTKAQICDRYGILTRNGKPDYKRLNLLLEHHGITNNSDAWYLTATIQESHQLKREFLPLLDQLLLSSDRQLWIGE